MDKHKFRIKTEKSSTFMPLGKMLEQSQTLITQRLNRTNHSRSSLRQTIQRMATRANPKEDIIKQENTRLLSRIMEIKRRKTERNDEESVSFIKKKGVSLKEWQIHKENKRLGISLIKIKSGKTVQKVKTQIAKNQQRKAKKKRIAILKKQKQETLRQHSQGHNPQNEPQYYQQEKLRLSQTTKALKRSNFYEFSQVGKK